MSRRRHGEIPLRLLRLEQRLAAPASDTCQGRADSFATLEKNGGRFGNDVRAVG